MTKSFLTVLKSAIGVLVLCVFTSTSFAAVDMFLEIKDLKGKVVSRCEVSKDGSFDCPALPAGEYTASVSWSWGATNASASSSSGMSSGKRSSSSSDASTSQWASMCTDISFHYTVKSPRDVASGQASGKRTHKPLKIVKSLDKSSPQLAKTLDKSTPKLMLGSFTIDDDCDGISGKISGSSDGKPIEIESWSWGVSNHGSSR